MARPKNPPVDDDPFADEQGTEEAEGAQEEQGGEGTYAGVGSKIPSRTSFDDRLKLLKIQARSSRANPQLETVNGQHLQLVGVTITKMRGGKYRNESGEERDKATFICQDGNAYDAQSDAALTSAHVLLDVLGTPPWPKAVEVIVEEVSTERGLRHFVSPV